MPAPDPSSAAFARALEDELARRNSGVLSGLDVLQEVSRISPIELTTQVPLETEKPAASLKRALAVYQNLSRLGPLIVDAQKSISLEMLLAERGERFVDRAYLSIMGRPADESGREHFLRRLGDGTITRLYFLGVLRYSAEGKRLRVRVPGLVLRYGLELAVRTPYIGRICRFIQVLAGLPSLVTSVETLADDQRVLREAEWRNTYKILEEVEKAVHQLSTSLDVARNDDQLMRGVLQRSLNDHRERINLLLDTSVRALRALSRDRRDLNKTFSALEAAHLSISAIHAKIAARDTAVANAIAEVQSSGQLALNLYVERAGVAHLDLREVVDSVGQTVQTAIALNTDNHEDQLKRLEAMRFELGEQIQRSRSASLLEETLQADRLSTVHAMLDQQSEAIARELQARAVALDAIRDELGEQMHHIRSAATLEIALQADRLTAVHALLNEQASAMARCADVDAIRNDLGGQIDQLRDSVSLVSQTHGDSLDLAQLQIDEKVANVRDQMQAWTIQLNLDTLNIATSNAAFAARALDAFYVSFEDRFRGTRPDIKNRVSVYLPQVHRASAGRDDTPIIDLGCGRGEWLELLKENGLKAIGIDQNRVMIDQCRALGLEVLEEDAVAYLQRLNPNTLGAITGIHIIEHLPFPRLIELLDAALSALKPGGIVIFETPNPENIQVGACNFYYDPTHIRPIPPESIRFIVQERGFAEVEIVRLHPVEDGEGADTALKKFLSAQDYGVIAKKP